MATVIIEISAEKITAVPVGYDKNTKIQFSNFGGAQKPWKWDGEKWEIDGAEKVAYWKERVEKMFAGWKVSPAQYQYK
jgi:hypothetical protein